MGKSFTTLSLILPMDFYFVKHDRNFLPQKTVIIIFDGILEYKWNRDVKYNLKH